MPIEQWEAMRGEGITATKAALYFAATPVLDYLANGRVQTRDGNRDPSAAPHAVYRCAGDDRWCAVACETNAQWRALAHLIGRPDLAADPELAAADGRKRREAELDAAVEAWTLVRSPDEAMGACQAAGVPAGAARDCSDLFADPQMAHRGHFVFLDHPEMGRYASDANCFRLSESPPDYRRAPLLGERTERAMRDILRMSEADYRALADAGVFD